jgi:hypothetical protein
MTAVFPIGHYMGERHPEGLHYVRVGLAHQTMTADEFGVWVLAHDESPQWSVENVVTLATAAELPNPAEAVERLLSAGVLATATDEAAFTRSYRAEPLLTGIGNTAEDPDTYAVGLPNREPTLLTADGYELWQWSALAPTLWHICEIRAKVLDRALTEVVPELLTDLRPLLANNCAYLDKAR